MLFAGYSTVSSGICNALRLVAGSAEAQAAILAEIASWPEEERRKGGALDYRRGG